MTDSVNLPHFLSVTAEPSISRFDLEVFFDVENQEDVDPNYSESMKNSMGIVMSVSDLRQLGFIPNVFTGTTIILSEDDRNQSDEKDANLVKEKTLEIMKQNDVLEAQNAVWFNKYTKITAFNRDLLAKMKEMKETHETEILFLTNELLKKVRLESELTLVKDDEDNQAQTGEPDEVGIGSNLEISSVEIPETTKFPSSSSSTPAVFETSDEHVLKVLYSVF
jgi:hypothetical protein